MEFKSKAQKYRVLIQWDEKKQEFIAIAPELGNCMARAKTQREAIELINTNIEQYLDKLDKQNMPVPIPFAERQFSGKILVRIDPNLHRDIAMQAAMEGISMSQYIEGKLKSE